MLIKRRRSIFASWLVLAALLFAQAAQAALPCLSADSGPVMAYSEHDDHEDDACEHTDNPNACLNQCTQDSQTSAHAEFPPVIPALVPVLTVAQDALMVRAQTAACDNVSPHVASSPPLSIRFCSYLI